MPLNFTIPERGKLVRARRFFVLSLLSVFLLSAFAPLPQDPELSVLDRVAQIVASFFSLGGVAAIVTALVAFARSQNWVKTDEQAGRLMATLNLIGFAVLVYFGIFRPDLALDYLDSTAATIASVLVFALGLIGQILLPAPLLRLAYQARVPVLGAMGERVEVRAHIVRATENPEPPENWSADLPPHRK